MQQVDSQLIGWTAILGGVVAIIGFISLILLFIVGEPFGTINDLLSIPTAVLMLPLVFALRLANAPEAPAAAWAAFLAGLLGFVATAIGSVLLVSGRIDFNRSLVYGLGGFGLIGLWALLNSAVGLRSHQWPAGVAWMGILLGVFPVLLLPALLSVERVGNALNGMASGSVAGPGLMLASAIGFICYGGLPVWFILMGRLFLSGRLAVTPAALA